MKFNKNKGFTLVEMLATVVILGLIMIVALPLYSSVYNSIKATTYLNTLKTVKVASLDYGSNTYVKDSIKRLSYKTDSTKYDWCKTVNIKDLIKAGYIKSDSNQFEEITDVYTGYQIGYNSLYNDTVDVSTMSLCYCKDTLDIDAFLTKDLNAGQIYIAGEYIRVVKKNDYYTFRYVEKSFMYDDLLSTVIKALKRGESKCTYEGDEIKFGSAFAGITEYDLSNDAFYEKFNSFVIDKFTSASKCNH